MSLKPDHWICKMAAEAGMIEPFAAEQVRQGVISYGVSAYGYDMRLGREFHFPQAADTEILDPKAADQLRYEIVTADTVILPPHGSVLARSLEYFRIPREVLALCFGKSTYARCGVFPHITPLEPEWEGVVTIKIFNLSPQAVRLHAGEGIAQVVFIGAEGVCTTSYRDKKGKYQGQKGVTRSRL